MKLKFINPTASEMASSTSSENRSVISKWLFARLSIFQRDKKEVLDDIRESIRDRYLSEHLKDDSDFLSKTQRPKIKSENDVYLEAVKVSIKDLNGLVEAIVLCDSLVNYVGFNADYLNKIPVVFNHSPSAWFFAVDPDLANDVYSVIQDSIQIKSGILKEEPIIDILLFLDWLIQCGIKEHCVKALKKEGVDHNFMELASPRNLYGTNAMNLTKESAQSIENYITKILGQEWLAYKNEVASSFYWPKELAGGRYYSDQIHEMNRQVGLFSEFKISLDLGTLSVSSLASGNYLNRLSRYGANSYNIKHFLSRRYQEKIIHEWTDLGFGTLDLNIPPLFRMCLKDASDIKTVLNNAIKLREQKWAVDLRAYINDLVNTKNEIKRIRNLKRIDNHLENTLSKIGSKTAYGMGFSTSGEISLSLPILHERFLRWKNPAMVMYTKMSNVLSHSDSVLDIKRVFKIEQNEAEKMISSINF